MLLQPTTGYGSRNGVIEVTVQGRLQNELAFVRACVTERRRVTSRLSHVTVIPVTIIRAVTA